MAKKLKIGLFGTADSGKTVLLTSMLWHLKNQGRNASLFPLGKGGEGKIQDFKLETTHHQFNFRGHMHNLVEKGGWPMRTKDFSIAKCSYTRSDFTFGSRDVSFVDIPGDRVPDVHMWRAKNFAEWSEVMFSLWEEDEDILDCMKDFMKLCNNHPDSDFKRKLTDVYKQCLKKLLENYSPVLTPSTFLLKENGDILPSLDDETVGKRKIWDFGDFFPLPDSWAEESGELRRIYRECELCFTQYKQRVLKPLFGEIDDCDGFIICIDIFDILVNGPSKRSQVISEVDKFFNLIKPRKFAKYLVQIHDIVKGLSRGMLELPFGRKPKVAYVATKSDMALRYDDMDKLEHLLEDIVCHSNQSSLVDTKLFTCCAAKCYECTDDEVFYKINGATKPMGIEYWPKLPSRWPNRNVNWYEKYKNFFIPAEPLQKSVNEPPEQDNLNKVFDYITED